MLIHNEIGERFELKPDDLKGREVILTKPFIGENVRVSAGWMGIVAAVIKNRNAVLAGRGCHECGVDLTIEVPISWLELVYEIPF
jgi:hypothetical protein